MNNLEIYVFTFIITALWDIVLRIMSENYDNLLPIFQYDFIKYLQPYFEKHTILSAALLAGFVGFLTQQIILNIQEFPTNIYKYQDVLQFLVITFIISALFGFIMKWSRLFPHLEKTYYKKLGIIRSMYHDGISGIIVQITLLVLLQVI